MHGSFISPWPPSAAMCASAASASSRTASSWPTASCWRTTRWCRPVARIGARTKIGTYTKIGRGVRIGQDCSFTSFCEIRDQCQLGDRVLMGSRGTLSAGTVVEDEVVMKYAFVVTDTPDLLKNNEKSPGHLKRKSRFGASVVIMPSVTIGENAESAPAPRCARTCRTTRSGSAPRPKYYREADGAAAPAVAAPVLKLALSR